MRQGSNLYYFAADHLGSTSLTTDANGTAVARQLYDAWGNIRANVTTGKMPTDIGYTGQRLDASTGGLMFYNARYYAPYLNRFISADTMVPDAMNPQAFNRYSYANNNPLRYNDPTGHAYAECLAFAPAGGWVGPAVCVGVEFAIDVIVLVSVAQALEQNNELQQRRQQYLEQLNPASAETTIEDTLTRSVARVAGKLPGVSEKAQGEFTKELDRVRSILFDKADSEDEDEDYWFQGSNSNHSPNRRNKSEEQKRTGNQFQNKAFNEGVNRLERELGKKLNIKQVERLHIQMQKVYEGEYEMRNVFEEGLKLFEK